MPPSEDFSITLTDSPDPDDNAYIDQMIKQFNNDVSPHHLAGRQPDAEGLWHQKVIQNLLAFSPKSRHT